MLDEFLLGGEVQETSKKNVLKAIAAQDLLQEVGTFPFLDISTFFFTEKQVCYVKQVSNSLFLFI